MTANHCEKAGQYELRSISRRKTHEEIVRDATRNEWLARSGSRIELKAMRRGGSAQRYAGKHERNTHKLYDSFSSISMIAAWLPQR